MKSKENDILALFFEQPTREWHFEEILRTAKMSRGKATQWLKKLQQEGVINKVKEKGKMPYYASDYDNPAYKNKKKLFAFQQLYDSGLLNHLSSLPKADTVILFGSFVRSDWYQNSDIDVFIYGSPEGLHIAEYELRLHKDIQVFISKTPEDLCKLGNDFIKNIIKGNLVKGTLDFVEVNAHA